MASKQLELWSRPAGTVQSRGTREAAASTTASKPADTVAALPCTAERVQFYVDQSRAHRTRTAYDQGFRAFERWCAVNGLRALPATSESIVLYLTTLLESGRKLSTVKRARVAIGQAHAAARLPRSDRAHQVRELERGMGRVHGTREEGAPPLLHEQVVQITKAIRAGARGDRDRVLLLLGFWGAFRASELAGLRIEDVTVEPAHLRVLVRRSKEDQLGRGEIVRIDASPQPELCVVGAVSRWLQRVGESSGPLLRQVHGRNILQNSLQPRARVTCCSQARGQRRPWTPILSTFPTRWPCYQRIRAWRERARYPGTRPVEGSTIARPLHPPRCVHFSPGHRRRVWLMPPVCASAGSSS